MRYLMTNQIHVANLVDILDYISYYFIIADKMSVKCDLVLPSLSHFEQLKCNENAYILDELSD